MANPNNERTTANHPLARGLGWLSLGLGAAEVLAPRRLARLLGIRSGLWSSGIIRSCGARELVSGLGVLSSHKSRFWLQARLAGDAMDAALLWRALGRRSWYSFFTDRARRSRLTGALLAVGGISLLDAVAFGLGTKKRWQERRAQPKAVVKASITVDRSAADIYAFLRELENLPRFISYLDSVITSDRTTSHWRAKLPWGPALEWDATITEDQPDRRFAWKVQSGKLAVMIDSGELRLEPAPGGNGTEVHLTLWGGPLRAPKVVDRWLRKLPERFWSAQLHRLKQLLELGEITVSDASAFTKPHPAQPVKEEMTSAPLASSAAPTPGPAVAEERRPS